MTQSNADNLEKKIKKHIYGKPQAAKITFPAGFGETALNEVTTILKTPWFAQKCTGECTLLKNEIHIDNIHMSSLMELLIRGQCITDIRLIIFSGKASGKAAFEKKCRDIPWNFFLNNDMSLKIKVNSVASRAFHETGLKEILTSILKNHTQQIVSGENTRETTCIYADLYKDRLTVSISLAGDALYKRGYRVILSASAPLREDAASACIKKSLDFAKSINEKFSATHILIPFSGTGTFAFEYLQQYFNFSPALFAREYALQKMLLFRLDTFRFLLKKAKEHCKFTNEKMIIYCIDNSESAQDVLTKNLTLFQNAFKENNHSLSDELFIQKTDNFLETEVSNLISTPENIFMPLNPPYGIRLGRNLDSIALYKKIASKINDIFQFIKKHNQHITGFILCPNEETWSAFNKQLTHAKTQTYHFTQGGIDIRVCQFFL